MSRQPEDRRPAALRILTDSTAAATLAVGGFLAVFSALRGLGWTLRHDLTPGHAAAASMADQITGALSPVGAALVGLLMLFGAGLVFLLNRPHNLRWLAITLAGLSVIGLSPNTPWLDALIVACCVLGWASQYLPQRETSATVEA